MKLSAQTKQLANFNPAHIALWVGGLSMLVALTWLWMTFGTQVYMERVLSGLAGCLQI